MLQPSTILRGVWQAPPSSAASWAARGCNAFVDLQQGANRAATLDACTAAGLKMLIEPGATGPDLAADLHHPGFLGWILKPDEPENDEHIPTRDAAGRRDYKSAAQKWTDQFNRLKGASTQTPLFGNFNGMILTAARESWTGTNKPPAEQNITLPEYSAFMAACDWVSADWHVRNSGRTADKIIPLYSTMFGRLQSQSGGKPTVAVVECAYEHRPENGPGPSGAEIRAQVWASLILGAVGIIYFPAKIGGGYVADNMTAEQAAAVSQCNDEIKCAEPWLLKGKRIQIPPLTLIPGNSVAASWTLDGQEMQAGVRWDGITLATVVKIPNVPAPIPPPVDPELAALRARVKRIDDWVKAYPQN